MNVKLVLLSALFFLLLGCDSGGGDSKPTAVLSEDTLICLEKLEAQDISLVEQSCYLNYITLEAADQVCCDEWIAQRNIGSN